MSRKLMAMMLAIGLVIGLVGGFFGGYFYNNFKAEDGGQISGGSRPPSQLLEVVKNPVSLDIGGLNYFTNMEVVSAKPSEPFNCKDYEGFQPYNGEPMPFYRHLNDIAVVQKGEWVERSTNMLLTKWEGSPYGIEDIYTVTLSEDGLQYIATLSESYYKDRPESNYLMYKDARTGAESYTDKIFGPLKRAGKRHFAETKRTICEKAGTTGTGGGGQ